MTPYLLAAVTEGIPSVIYGLMRPISFAAIVLMAWKTPLISPCARRLMMLGAAGNFTTSIVFLFVNAGIPIHEFWPDYAQLVATPSIVVFTLGLAWAAIGVGGLRWGNGN
jgi:hypothetical protein